jgi:hypothetical protein
MGYPTEDGSEHERLREVPRAGIRTAHIEVFYLGKSTYVLCLWMVFLVGRFWFILVNVLKNHGGYFFMGKSCICDFYICLWCIY